MPTDKDLLNKGIKFLVYALPLFFIGPPVIYNAFQNQQNNWHYVVLAVGITMCFGAVYFAFRGLATIVRSMKDE
ncbi:hypothetical protein HUK80_00585 [Flavobacterium sp. MAH-1]|uniref:Uncharacterized protein n=1 Tax=Flavobacterium agri TaxID=2743471 RepID=A0A7Y8XYV6_9FLAO|nr:DUF6095 family protein [Flavobacterium agri]NUY79374.1 hypothetical protein [Flavobacterium agri]NYA69398.1 hypothetical protein [Flavobacterium agri]